MRKLLFILVLWISAVDPLLAQDQLLQVGKEYLIKQDYVKALEIYEKLYGNNPNNPVFIDGYIQCLMGMKEYKKAEKLLKNQLKENKTQITALKLVELYKQTEQEKKAKKITEELISDASAKETDAKILGQSFSQKKFYNEAIQLYTEARTKLNNPLLFTEELSVIYDQQGDFAKGAAALIDLAQVQPEKIEYIKSNLLRIMNDSAKKAQLKMIIQDKINSSPKEFIYPDLMGWYSMHMGDYDQALSQIKKADELGSFNGKKINLFAQAALSEGKMDLAENAYNYILSMGKESSEYLNALTNKIDLLQKKLESNPKYSTKQVKDLIQTYEEYFENYPQKKVTESYRNYASVVARYTDDIGKAIQLLESFTSKPNVPSLLKNKAKLDLGDYHLIAGNNWQATLIYSQVDKEYKNDALGEEARFRNAKLSYYIGDYVWAQGQLDILKSSTSELIANDALNLSVLITENTPMDSNYTPLEMFSRADLLIFRNKYREASNVLDSLASQYPDNPLADDILMARASIATKQQDFTQAVGFYKQVYEKHKEDILADDALFKAAVIHEQYLNNPKEAQFLYEKIILDYSNSTLIGEARKSFRRLRGDGIQ